MFRQVLWSRITSEQALISSELQRLPSAAPHYRMKLCPEYKNCKISPAANHDDAIDDRDVVGG